MFAPPKCELSRPTRTSITFVRSLLFVVSLFLSICIVRVYLWPVITRYAYFEDGGSVLDVETKDALSEK